MKIELKFDNTVTRLAGNPYGKDVYKTQVKNRYTDYSETLTIIFPDNIEKVASSFIQGFFDELVQEIGYDGIEHNIVIQSKSDYLSNKIRERIN